jgi:hypothetical protein
MSQIYEHCALIYTSRLSLCLYLPNSAKVLLLMGPLGALSSAAVILICLNAYICYVQLFYLNYFLTLHPSDELNLKYTDRFRAYEIKFKCI